MRRYRRLPPAAAVIAVLVANLVGCGRHPAATFPVEGKVMFNGTPLSFGAVAFMPEKGPLARGRIESNGTFRLTTYKENDGAVPGIHRVRITCYEAQRPGFEMPKVEGFGMGKSLIPVKYTQVDTSGLRVEVTDRNEPFVFDLR
jgi:hypothetical protein